MGVRVIRGLVAYVLNDFDFLVYDVPRLPDRSRTDAIGHLQEGDQRVSGQTREMTFAMEQTSQSLSSACSSTSDERTLHSCSRAEVS